MGEASRDDVEHVVTVEARVNHGMGAYGPAAALVARCACGWMHTLVPNEGQEATILWYGLRHVAKTMPARDAEPVAADVGRARV